jgi:hypothetical protein
VQPGCGCTASEYTKEPILPGKKGEIKVHYNTATVAPFKKLLMYFLMTLQTEELYYTFKELL